MAPQNSLPASGKNAVVVVHGGAGAIDKTKLTAAREREAKAKLEQALQAGYKAIAAGGNSLDAVVAAVKVLEDASIYNAGRGSCLTRSGKIEMDAAIMNGTTLAAGAVASITCVKNPITAARAVMEHTHHVLLVGTGANSFAKKIAPKAGLKIVEPNYFKTAHAELSLKHYLEAEAEAKKRGHKMPSGLTTGESQCDMPHEEPLGKKYGTVGAVAVDKAGHIAAATSTGGTVGKEPGRVGDTPIIGAGTYADDQTCALSATGDGEHFIRGAVGHEVSALVRHLGLTVKQAADRVVEVTLARTAGDGGVILIDAKGNYAIRYNTLGMYRGVIFEDGSIQTAIYHD
jgi:L-asparaginase / beta-aspartyl-peptidase